MRMEIAKKIYQEGKPLDPATLEGTYQVEMGGIWRWMCRDRKIIKDGKGYNVFSLWGSERRWGLFWVMTRGNKVFLLYLNNLICDYLVAWPENPSWFVGRFCIQILFWDVPLAYFVLRLVDTEGKHEL